MIDEAKIREWIKKDVARWFVDSGHEPMKLRILAQRYAKRLKPLGLNIRDVVESEPGLMMKMTQNGGYLVVPDALFIPLVEAGRIDAREYWERFKGLEV